MGTLSLTSEDIPKHDKILLMKILADFERCESAIPDPFELAFFLEKLSVSFEA